MKTKTPGTPIISDSKFKIIVIGFVAITILTALHFIPAKQGGNHVWPNYKVEFKAASGTFTNVSDQEAFTAYTNWAHGAIDRYAKIQPKAPSEPQTVTIRFAPRGTNEVRMIEKMTQALATPEHVPDEKTIRHLVLARLKAWPANMPESWRSSPDWARIQGESVKREISRILETTDSLTIKRVLECNLGTSTNLWPAVPPMENFEVENLKESAQ